MKLLGSEGLLLMEVESITAKDHTIHIKGRMMGQVPMTAVLKPGDVREAWKLVSWSVIWQAARIFFMRGDM
jgi:hypothetical protein